MFVWLYQYVGNTGIYPIKRCVIYTRTSSSEGLEKEFNSLEAQREACTAYISSQKHEGYQLIPEHYDDGGYSGGNIERPELKRLIDAIEQDAIDIVVIYKLDRLSRSISDFGRLMGILDKHQVDLISITQPINTANSMGRLTLHMLLSFAQFERDVTGERIRDKFAASKKKGMWMGGSIPIGYDAIEKKLVINQREKQIVQLIFKTFLETHSFVETCDRVNKMGFKTKRYLRKNGCIYGEELFTRSTLRKILINRVYLGKIHHKGAWLAGQHKAIIDHNLWNQTEAILKTGTQIRRLESRNRNNPSILRGLLYGPDGNQLVPSSGLIKKKRCCFYSYPPSRNKNRTPSPLPRIEAKLLEELVLDNIVYALEHVAISKSNEGEGKFEAGHSFINHWESLLMNERNYFIRELVNDIKIDENKIKIAMNSDALSEFRTTLKKNGHSMQAAKN